MKQYDKLRRTNEKIISAILKKAERICPNAIDFIGVYGTYESFI